MTIKEEMTTPVAPVGAGAEQSSQNQSTSIIPEINRDFNTSDDFFQNPSIRSTHISTNLPTDPYIFLLYRFLL